MRGWTGSSWHRGFRLGLILGALALLVITGRAALDLDIPTAWAPGVVILAMHAIARRFPLRLGGRNRVEVGASTSLGFALLIAVPGPLAVLGLAGAALITPPGGRLGSWSRRVLEVCRATLVYSAAAWTMQATGSLLGTSPVAVSWHLVVILLPAAALSYVLDAMLTALSVAVEQHASARTVLRQARARYEFAAYLLLVYLAPFAVVLVERSLVLAPSLVVALVLLYRFAGASAQQQHEALHDALTGLPNRRQLELRLTELIASAGDAEPHRFALLLMDLDRFTEVNEQLGRELGDELLEHVAERLRTIEGVDLVARIGGDEFAVIVRQVGDAEELLHLGEGVIRAVSRPYVVGGIRIAVGATIGLAVYPEQGLDGAALLRRADSATYAAKRDGTPVGLAAGDGGRGLPGRVSLVSQLEQAMRRDELQLEYQPKQCLHTGDIVGVESLLRWHHPDHGVVPPDAFMTTVEHTDLIAPLTRHVLRKALGDLQRWHSNGLPGLPVAVNISTRDLQDVRFPDELSQLLRAHGVAPAALTLEITETALQVDPDRAALVLGRLRELGVRLSIDDFGTGYSSLAALRHLPVSELKIDRVFVCAMLEDEAGRAIVRSMVQLGQALQLEVVAEGVEDAHLLGELRSYGCDVVQGFVVGRPLPPHLVAPWVRARRAELAEYHAAPLTRTVHALARPRSRSRVG